MSFPLTLLLLTGALAPPSLGALDDDPEAESTWEYLAERYDADGDGKITRKEYARDDEHFARLDTDGDGVLTEAEVSQLDGGRGRGGVRRGGGRGQQPPAPVAPKAGQRAPDFELVVLERAPLLDEEVEEPEEPKPKPKTEKKPETVKLSAFARQKRPVALIFGSYT